MENPKEMFCLAEEILANKQVMDEAANLGFTKEAVEAMNIHELKALLLRINESINRK